MFEQLGSSFDPMGYWEMRAALEWQVALGVDEAILDEPIDRTKVSEAIPTSTEAPNIVPAQEQSPNAVGIAEELAKGADTLEKLRAAMEGFDLCELKQGAKQLVFADGQPGARVMIVGEAPGRDEDIQGKPFVGRAGQLLDLMFSHIGLSREAPDKERALYITNVLPWRPPQNRDPKPDEMAMMLPFLRQHVSLIDPDLIVAMGNHACQALLEKRGITRLRGHWGSAMGKPVLPMFHPAYLLRTPDAKREAWLDLLSLRSKLGGGHESD